MIDIHAHILPAVDDGSSSMAESLQMLKIAERENITTLVVTPHIFSHLSMGKSFEELNLIFSELITRAQKKNLKINLLKGAEVYFCSDLKDKFKDFSEFLTLNKSGYFLLEFPFQLIFPGTKEFVFDIMSEGFIPIICHPERNQAFQRSPDLLFELVKVGALTQIDAGSIRGDFGLTARSAAMNFLKNNLVHVMATDCHHQNSRPPEISFLFDLLKFLGPEKLDMLTNIIPSAIIENKVIPDIGVQTPPREKSLIFDFVRKIFK